MKMAADTALILTTNCSFDPNIKLMDKTQLRNLIAQVLPIAQKAGDKKMEVYQDEASFDIESKDDNSPLTRADREANDIICQHLELLTPKLPIISEENKDCLLYTSPSPRDQRGSRMPSSA